MSGETAVAPVTVTQTAGPTDVAPATPPVVTPPSSTASQMDVGGAFANPAPSGNVDPTAITQDGRPVGQTAEQKQNAFYNAIEGKTPEEVVAIAAKRGILPTAPADTPQGEDVQVAPKEEKPAVTQGFDMAKADSVLEAIKNNKQQSDSSTANPQEPEKQPVENESETLNRISELEQTIVREQAAKKELEFTIKETEENYKYQIKAKDEANAQLRSKLSQYESNVNLFEVKDPLQKTVVESAQAYSAEQTEDNLYAHLGAIAQYWHALTKQDISTNIANLKQVVTTAKVITSEPGNVVNYAKSLQEMQKSNNVQEQQQQAAAARKAKALNVG